MDAYQILSMDLQECRGDILDHEECIDRWLEMDGKPLDKEQIMDAMKLAFGMSFEADEALNRVHERLFGALLYE